MTRLQKRKHRTWGLGAQNPMSGLQALNGPSESAQSDNRSQRLPPYGVGVSARALRIRRLYGKDNSRA